MSIRSAPAASAANLASFAPLADGVTLMRASFADHAFERHSHDCFAVGTTLHGIQRFRCRGHGHDSLPGDLVLFNPDEDHDGHPGSDAGFRYAIWYLPEAFLRSCLDDDAGGARGLPYFAAPHVTDPAAAAAFAALTRELLAAPSETLRAESLMRGLLGRLLARHGERPPATTLPARGAGNAHLVRVKDYIRAHFRRDLDSAELAAVANVSRAHLNRSFNAAFHTPPHVFLNTVRIRHAQALIRRGMALADVAAECGFADQSHLTRRFKGCVGVTPAQWRRMVAGVSTDSRRCPA